MVEIYCRNCERQTNHTYLGTLCYTKVVEGVVVQKERVGSYQCIKCNTIRDGPAQNE